MERTEKSTRTKVLQIFLAYVKSMLFAFTGGTMTLPLLEQELDDTYHLMDKDKVLEYFAVGQSLPGAISLNTGLLLGREIAGWPGAIAAAAGVILPAFFGMLLIVFSYSLVNRLAFVKGMIEGFRAASIAVIFSNAVSILRTVRSRAGYALGAFALVATLIFRWSMLGTILLCGCAGILRIWCRNRKKAA